MRHFIAAAALCLAGCTLGSCTAQEEADIESACHVASDAELLDPALASHNAKVVNGQTVICADAPLFQAPASSAPTAVPAQ